MGANNEILLKLSTRRKAAIGIVVLVGLGLLLLGAYHWAIQRQIDKHYRFLKSQGVPTDVQSIIALYQPRKLEENAAPYYQKVCTLLTNIESLGQRNLLPTNEVYQLKEKNRNYFQEIVNKNEAAFEALKEAAKYERAYYHLEWEDHYQMSVGHLPPISQIYKLLQLKAALALHNGDVEQIVELIELTLKVSESLQDEPLLISALTRIKGQIVASRMTKLALNNGLTNQNKLLKLQTAFSGIENRKHFIQAFQTERLAISEMMNDPEKINKLISGSTGGTDSGINVSIRLLRLGGAWKYDRLFASDTIWLLEEALRNKTNSLELLAVSERKVEETFREISLARGGLQWKKAISRMMLPNLIKASHRMIRTEARVAITITGLAAKRYEAKYQAFPDSLKDLVPEFLDQLPENIGSGIELEYENNGNEISIWAYDHFLEEPTSSNLINQNQIDLTLTIKSEKGNKD